MNIEEALKVILFSCVSDCILRMIYTMYFIVSAGQKNLAELLINN